jgi:VanZ family protein
MSRWPPTVYLALPLVWMGLIYFFSAQPTLPQVPGALADLLLKKGAHMAVYTVLVLLWWRALTARWCFASPTVPIALAWLAALAYAASDEFHQTYVPGRNGTVVDVVIDGAGAALGAVGLWWAARLHAPGSGAIR